jgi:hypothetical protein
MIRPDVHVEAMSRDDRRQYEEEATNMWRHQGLPKDYDWTDRDCCGTCRVICHVCTVVRECSFVEAQSERIFPYAGNGWVGGP